SPLCPSTPLFRSRLGAPGLDVGERVGPVDLRLALSEQVQVGAVENHDRGVGQGAGHGSSGPFGMRAGGPAGAAAGTRFITVRGGPAGSYVHSMIDAVYPPKPVPGDRIAVLSPSSGL